MDDHYPDGECECHCPTCGESREPGPYGGFATCGDCYGGKEPDGEAFRGGEAAAYEREQMAGWQRLK
jgi:hypothetical protein